MLGCILPTPPPHTYPSTPHPPRGTSLPHLGIPTLQRGKPLNVQTIQTDSVMTRVGEAFSPAAGQAYIA